MILIGVGSSFFHPDPARDVFGHKTLQYLERDMARYLLRDNVLPVLIPDVDDSRLEKIFEKISALVLQGGSDLSPKSYGEVPLDSSRWPGDPYRDEYELKLIALAHKKKMPVFGICRGAQLINVYFGGTLYQDLATETATPVLHRDAHLYDRVVHDVTIETGGLLEKIYPATRHIQVNSVHHQGIRVLGKSLKVEARCKADGLIEAISYNNPDEFFCLGVQWHPEFSHSLPGKLADPEPLYQRFLTPCINSKTPSQNL